MKKFLSEFKEFISKGNVMTMAVGIIMGSTFTAIINSLVNDIITPIIGMVIGGVDFSGICLTVGSASITLGVFIQAVINFLLTALILFLVVKAFNRFQRKKEEVPKKDPEPSAEEKLLTEIRDLLKNK
ncbi:MAG: large-conductance mechanosensitive channel protein MscL [Lachnospiraceae bacterium]|nr:large-conductance mechanosensitive channel protein MscL [Lachnospiraceae bacterium]